MKKIKFFNSLGEISKTMLIVVGIIVVAVIMVIIIISPRKPKTPPPPVEVKEPEPVYEATINNIKFNLYEAKDLGDTLLASESKFLGREDETTTERFIRVTVTAENIGKKNTVGGIWGLGELIDTEEREFAFDNTLDPWIINNNQCGAVLKPGFIPVYCTKIYNVAKVSSGLKLKIFVTDQKGRKDAFIDLKF